MSTSQPRNPLNASLSCMLLSMVAIGGIRHIAAGVADAGVQHAGVAAQQVLHPPEAAAGEDRGFG
jgi:hypothetical protein